MLQVLPGLPDNVLGIKAVGEVEEDDYEDILEPAIEDRLSRHDKIRFLYILGPEFEGYEGEALLEDAKLGLKTFTKYEKVAVVTDTQWIRRSIKAFGWMMPGEVSTFTMADLEAARDWVSA